MKHIWYPDDFPMTVLNWTLSFNPMEESPIVLVWVKFLELPIRFFNKHALFVTAIMIRTPLEIDESTANYVRPGVARACMELNLLGELEKEIGLGIGTTIIIQPIIYEQHP